MSHSVEAAEIRQRAQAFRAAAAQSLRRSMTDGLDERHRAADIAEAASMHAMAQEYEAAAGRIEAFTAVVDTGNASACSPTSP